MIIEVGACKLYDLPSESASKERNQAKWMAAVVLTHIQKEIIKRPLFTLEYRGLGRLMQISNGSAAKGKFLLFVSVISLT
jgi:hypothetical protein